jgi:hypothetical protein
MYEGKFRGICLPHPRHPPALGAAPRLPQAMQAAMAPISAFQAPI